MLKNFTRPEGEEPYYYSSTVENGEVISHDGELEHAVYKSEMDEISRRADLWHDWVSANVPNAYNSIGAMDGDVYAEHSDVREEFMDGLREK